jgi:hypothetical protein
VRNHRSSQPKDTIAHRRCQREGCWGLVGDWVNVIFGWVVLELIGIARTPTPFKSHEIGEP